MKILVLRDTAVTDYFTGKRVQLPDEYVRISMRFDEEFSLLTTVQSEWLLEHASATQCDEKAGILHFFVPYTGPLWRFAGYFDCQNLPFGLFWRFVQISKRQSFRIDGQEAFDFLTLLYTSLSQAIRDGGHWLYQDGDQWELEYLPSRWSLAVRVPDEIQRIAIGRRGETVRVVEQYTECLKFRLSFKD